MSDLAIANTFFQKKLQHLITYRSGSYSTQIDYLLVRRGRCHIGKVTNCKAIPEESLTAQHRLLVLVSRNSLRRSRISRSIHSAITAAGKRVLGSSRGGRTIDKDGVQECRLR
ncbi:hypothetical protein PYW07_004647 [Mythimna separata]|uniref:Uncharacterized protein n=1 Tax=Mythimna separata TaxID=271217 RepID=A0AAD7YZJ5_MYTSE|nr:hypothetical protein PYW07_004647 [Mythimna separata]